MRILPPTLALAGLISLTSAANFTAEIKHNTYNPPGHTTTDGTCGQQSPHGATCINSELGNCCSCKSPHKNFPHSNPSPWLIKHLHSIRMVRFL